MNAEVTMPIAQLDELRDSLKKSQEECKMLGENRSKIELTVKFQTQQRDYDREAQERYMASTRGSHNYGSSGLFNSGYSELREMWDGTIQAVPSYAKFKTVSKEVSHSFQNMEQFIEPLTEIAREKVRKELEQAEKTASFAVQDLAKAKGDYAKQSASMIEQHDKDVFKLTEVHKKSILTKDETIKGLETTIKELQGEAISLSKDEQIKKQKNAIGALITAIDTYNNKSNWNKLRSSLELPDMDKLLK